MSKKIAICSPNFVQVIRGRDRKMDFGIAKTFLIKVFHYKNKILRPHNFFRQILGCTSPVIFQITGLLDVKFEKIGGLEKCVLDAKCRVCEIVFSAG